MEDEYEYDDEENDLTRNNTWNGIELFGIDYFENWRRKWKPVDIKGRLFTAWLRDASVLQKRLLRSVLMMDPIDKFIALYDRRNRRLFYLRGRN